MPYSSHNLVQGDKLTEKTLQDIDNQLVWQDNQLTQLQDRIDAASETLDQSILEKLTIGADQTNVYLYYDGTQISEAALTADDSGVVPCTALTYPDNSDVQVKTGGAGVSVVPTKQPSNSTQTIKYYSESPGKVTVSSAGLVTATDACRTKVHAVCGMQEVVRNVIATKGIDLSDMYICGNPYWSSGNYLSITAPSNSNYDTINIGFEDAESVDSYIEVPSKYTVQVNVNDLDPTYVIFISMIGLLYPNTKSAYTGNDRINDHFGFGVTSWAGSTGPTRIFRNCTCIVTSKSASSASAGGTDSSWPAYAYGESDFLKNDNADTGYLILSFRIRNKTEGKQATPTQALINQLLNAGCIDVQLLPEEDYVPVEATSFTVTPSKVAAGATVDEITLAYTASRLPSAAAITHYAANAGSEKGFNIGTLAANVSVTKTISDCEIKTSRIFRLFLADEEGGVAEKTALLEFLNYAYYGIAQIPENDAYDSEWVNALGKKLIGTPIGGYEMPWESWSEGYVHLALPQRLAADRTFTFRDGTTALSFSVVATINVTNENDFTEQYVIYRCSAEQTAGLTLVVR